MGHSPAALGVTDSGLSAPGLCDEWDPGRESMSPAECASSRSMAVLMPLFKSPATEGDASTLQSASASLRQGTNKAGYIRSEKRRPCH